MKYNLGGEKEMEQVLVCLKTNGVLKLEVLDLRRRELVSLGKTILSGNIKSIEKHVVAALDAGASKDDILKVVSYIVSDNKLFGSIIELFKALSYEENRRTPCISAIDDVRE